MADFPITIYHNPRCSKSRQTLALIEDAGLIPTVRAYLADPLSEAELRALVESLDVPLAELLRPKEDAYKALNLHAPDCTDEDRIQAILQHPILLERPIVSSPKGVRLCRPPERVLDLLP